MLNTNNYFQKSQSIDWESLPEALSKGNKLVEGASQNNWAAYNSNENIKRVVDAIFRNYQITWIKIQVHQRKNQCLQKW